MNLQLTEKLNEARSLKHAFKLPETIAALKECLAIDPHCVIASAQAGLCSLMTGETAQAESFLEQAVKDTNKADAPVLAYYTAALIANGKDYGQYLPLCSGLQDTLLLVAEMLSEKDKHDEVLRLIEVLSDRYLATDLFKTPKAHYRLIRLLARAGETELAADLANGLEAETPDSWEGLAAQAAVEIAKKDYDKAYSLTVRALQRGGSSNPMLAAQQHWLALNK